MSRRPTAAARDLPPVPQRNWADLFGYDDVLSQMCELLAADRWPQVMLLEGREGIGKRKLLAQICGLMACDEQRACGSCQPCREVQNGFAPDLLWVETEGALKVAEADQIQEHLEYRAGSSLNGKGWRIVVVVDIENMTQQAANRLLKTLEEPPAQTRLLLSCGRPRQLLPTIASRLVRWRLQPPAQAVSLRWLEAQSAKAGYALSAADCELALEAQGLSPGRAWNMLVEQKNGLHESLSRLEDILLQPFDGQRLQELQELLKQRGWKAHAFAQQFELLLNRRYKDCLGLGSGKPKPRPSLPQLHQWRRVLQQVYRAGGHEHNHLNTQMVAEALGCT